MKLHTYYTITVDTHGKKNLSETEDPTLQDGFSREPLVYVDPDDDSIEDPNLPFSGVNVSFMGDHGTVAFLPVGEPVSTELDLDNEMSVAGIYYYRTGVYNDNETHTGFDAIVWVAPDND